jgi:predicted transcriptional regulator
MAVITSSSTTTYLSRRRTVAGPHMYRPAVEQYYIILKAILSGHGKSNFYQQKVTNDPRPILSLIVTLSHLGYDRVTSDLKHLVTNGLVRCYVDERKSVFIKSKKKRKPIRTYELTEKGLKYIADYDDNKLN